MSIKVWILLATLWIVGATVLNWYHRESVKLLVIVTAFVIIFTNLSRRKRAPGELSAYFILNKNFQRLDGELQPSAFGPQFRHMDRDNATQPATAVHHDHGNGGRGDDDESFPGQGRKLGGRVEAPPTTIAPGEQVQQDEAYQKRLARAVMVQPLHLCICGSGKRFGACCEPLRDRLREAGVHLT